MRVVIDQRVFEVLDEFYEIARERHITLTLETCLAKINRLEHSLLRFSAIAESFRKEPYRQDWKQAGYYEYEVEEFHFAYRIYQLPNGEKVLRFHDAVHGLLNH